MGLAVKPTFPLDFDRLAVYFLSTVEIAVCDIRNILVTTGIGTSVERPFQRTTSRPEIRRAGGDVTNPTTRPPGSPPHRRSAGVPTSDSRALPGHVPSGCLPQIHDLPIPPNPNIGY